MFVMGGGLFRPHNITIVVYFYYLILPKLLHVSVARPSSGRNILVRITRLTTDPLFLEFYCLLLLKLLHVSVVRPSSGRTIFVRIT
jgi:hypothetical protein